MFLASYLFTGEEKGIDDAQIIEHYCSYALYLLSKHTTGSNWEIMSKSVNWKAKLNICTPAPHETAWKTWERIINVCHVANEVQKILAQFLRKMKASLK